MRPSARYRLPAAVLTGVLFCVSGGHAFTSASQKKTAAKQKVKAPKKININRASWEELDTLPDIGKVRAEAIIRHREISGPFRKIEELIAVKGISRKIFEKLRGRITVTEKSEAAKEN